MTTVITSASTIKSFSSKKLLSLWYPMYLRLL